MAMFESDREAKEFLAGRISEEAKREGMPLSEVERKMLYFTETGWTLPDMAEISEEFDRDHDQDEYEQKIAGLVRGIETREDARSEQDIEAWDEAVLKLSEGDHYLLVLINPTLTSDGNAARSPHDRLKLWFTAFALIFGFFAMFALRDRIFGPDWNHFGVPR